MRKGLGRKGFQGVQGQQEWLAESVLMVTLVEDLEPRQMQGYIYRCMTRTRRTGKHPVSGTDYRIYILGFHGLAILRLHHPCVLVVRHTEKLPHGVEV